MAWCQECHHDSLDHEDGVGICFKHGCNCQDYTTVGEKRLREAYTHLLDLCATLTRASDEKQPSYTSATVYHAIEAVAEYVRGHHPEWVQARLDAAR